MTKRFLFLIISITWLSRLYGQNNPYSIQNDYANSILERIIEDNQIPGLAVTISISDNIVWAKGFGYANLEQKVLVEPSKTKFRIGSISKSFASIAIGNLLDQSKISLDDPIQNYVPDFPLKKYPITIRQLGGHLAGIRSYYGDEYYNTRKYKNLHDGLSIFKDDSLLFKPNTRFFYSNYGWNLISVAIENVSKNNYALFMDSVVFKPLCMISTVPDNNESIINNRSRFYEIDSLNTIVNARYVDNTYKLATGGYLSTVADLIKFGNHLLNPEIIGRKTFQVLIENQQTSSGEFTDYGIGWMVGNISDSIPFFGHTGTTVGGKALLIVVPEYELVFALAANLGEIDFGDDYYRIFEILNQYIIKN
jgi:CubicO group peptidase (beta-lactamase class C family)